MGRKFVHLQPKQLQQPSNPGAIKSHAKLGLQSVEKLSNRYRGTEKGDSVGQYGEIKLMEQGLSKMLRDFNFTPSSNQGCCFFIMNTILQCSWTC